MICGPLTSSTWEVLKEAKILQKVASFSFMFFSRSRTLDDVLKAKDGG